jgi:hypothetical protein
MLEMLRYALVLLKSERSNRFDAYGALTKREMVVCYQVRLLRHEGEPRVSLGEGSMVCSGAAWCWSWI